MPSSYLLTCHCNLLVFTLHLTHDNLPRTVSIILTHVSQSVHSLELFLSSFGSLDDLFWEMLSLLYKIDFSLLKWYNIKLHLFSFQVWENYGDIKNSWSVNFIYLEPRCLIHMREEVKMLIINNKNILRISSYL